MADQQNPLAVPTAPSADYGPFTSVLTGPLTPQQQVQPLSYAPSRTGALAMFANNFIQGLQKGQRTKFEQSEKQKMEHERNFDSVNDHIQADPTVSPEGKKLAAQIHLQKKYYDVNEGLKGAKDNKDHPLMNLVRTVAGAVTGPNQDKSHKDLNVNDLLSIRNDPKYRVDPQAVGTELSSQLTGALDKMAKGQAPQPSRDVTPPAALAAQPTPEAVQIPNVPGPTAQPPQYATKPVPGVPGQDVNAETVARNPEIAALNSRSLNTLGVPLSQNQYTAGALQGIARAPLTAPSPAEHGVTVAVMGPNGQVTGYKNALRATSGQLLDPNTRQPIPNAVEATSGLAAETRAVSPQTTMQKVWIKRPGAGDPEIAFIDPKHPNGYMDYRNQPIPDGAVPVAAPTEGSGQARTYAVMALSELKREGIANPTRDQIAIRTGEIAEKVTGSPMARREQEEAIDAALTGIPAGPGLSGTARPPSVAAPAAAPAATATTKPGAAPTAKAGEDRAPASTISKTNEDDAAYYLESLTGAQKGGGKGAQLKSQRGEKFIRAATGLDPSGLSVAFTDYKATQKALSDAVGVSNAYIRVQKALEEHGAVLADAAKAYGPGNTPIVNQTMQWFQQQSGPHPELTKYREAMQAVSNEYARLISGGVQSRAQLPISASARGEAVINPSMTMRDVVAAVSQLKIEADASQRGFSAQQDQLNQRLADNPISKAFRPSASTAPPGKISATVNGLTVEGFKTQADADAYVKEKTAQMASQTSGFSPNNPLAPGKK